MNLLSRAMAASLVVLAAPTLAAPPTPTDGLRFEVYSDSAAELFWPRSSDPEGFVRGYEIRRDGELVTTLDALSFFVDDLPAGRATGFTVTAVDFDGERSAPVGVTIATGAGAPAATAGPPAPGNLRAAVYSATAAEVFWDRVDGATLTYEVRVEGGPSVTTDGTSAFLSGLPLTDGVNVDVVAIGPGGARSAVASVMLGEGVPMTTGASATPEPSALPPGVVADGRDVQFPSDLWWEVLRAGDGEVVCVGSMVRCTLADGTYLMIDHTGDRRYPSVAFAASGPDLPSIRSLGVDRVLTAVADTLAGDWIDDLLDWYEMSVDPIVEGTGAVVPDEPARTFACPVSGSVTRSTLDRTSNGDTIRLAFSDCADGRFLANGTIDRIRSATGSLDDRPVDPTAPRPSVILERILDYTDFTLEDGSTTSVSIPDGVLDSRFVRTYLTNGDVRDQESRRYAMNDVGLRTGSGTATLESFFVLASRGTAAGLIRPRLSDSASATVRFDFAPNASATVSYSSRLGFPDRDRPEDPDAAGVGFSFNRTENVTAFLQGDLESGAVEVRLTSEGTTTTDDGLFAFRLPRLAPDD